MEEVKTHEIHNPEKLQDKLVELNSLKYQLEGIGADQELKDWIDFQIHQWENGLWRVVNINKKPAGAHNMLYYEPIYEKEWFSSPITYGVFLNWKIKNLIK